MAVLKLTWPKVMAWRLRRQHLDDRAKPKQALDVAARVCGLHAQLMASAELALAARIDKLPADVVSRALWEDRTLVKTWAMRGTLHLLPAQEHAMWMAACSQRKSWEKPVWLRSFGVTPEELDELIDAVGEALAGQVLTREELADQVTVLTGSPAQGERIRGSWGAYLKPAAFLGRICFGPSKGQNVCFTRPDTWIAGWERYDPEAAVLDVVRRYLAVYGPCTHDDLARWWGWSRAKTRQAIRHLGDEAVEVDVGGTIHWMLAGDVADARSATRSTSVRLVPAFDQYVVASPRGQTAILADEVKARVHRPQGWISPVLLVGGRMEGVWRHERTADRLVVEITPFDQPPPRVRRAAEAEAERLAAFTGADLELRWSS